MTVAEIVVSEDAIADLRPAVRGSVLLPGDEGYDAPRTVWNAMIDRHPALIVRAAGVADVIAAVNFAREHDLLFSVRGGGHNVTGSAVADGGLMLDMSAMKGIRVDPERRTVQAEAGCVWSDLDHETQAFGLAVTGGQVSDTGIAGLTLGGGVGHLMRYCGATVDNLLSVDLVTADGSLLTVSADQHPDLFWAVRGGGGNFGVATSLEYRLHPVGPIILGGMLLYPAGQGADILRYAAQPTSPMSIVPINPWGGAISRVAEDATALGHRDSAFSIYIFAVWPDPSDSERHIEWARAFHTALRPHMNGAYVNELGQEGRVHEAYPPATYARLVEVKNTYDPANFFRMNQNIKPTV